jgi:hypothetical protein
MALDKAKNVQRALSFAIAKGEKGRRWIKSLSTRIRQSRRGK